MNSERSYLEPVNGVFQIIVPSHSMLNGHCTNCFVIGQKGEDALIVDPSPKDDQEYEKLVLTLEHLAATHQFTYIGILITHGHGDHHMNAVRLSQQWPLPVFISDYTHQRMLAGKKDNPGADLDIRIVNEGDILIEWQNQDVMVYHIPGHDEGHLGLAPEDMSWFLAGDLIQQNGTVVIGSEEGDMDKYYHSLERIIKLKPKLVLPSHGMAVKGAKVLKKTLKHRQKREKEILKLYNQGLSPQQIVEIIYRKVDHRLWPLALENVKSHLKKLNLPF